MLFLGLCCLVFLFVHSMLRHASDDASPSEFVDMCVLFLGVSCVLGFQAELPWWHYLLASAYILAVNVGLAHLIKHTHLSYSNTLLFRAVGNMLAGFLGSLAYLL